ncbi:ROK family transcriptional regulator [Deinococcus psychrotolerans]|uniref:ROK family transcriptional regulator n=1 Tax=Deinococcus psychrotolerans TaxID=2489213 RepID=A0A3G8YHJ5_9DEIO|nr:ROK family transcriptional regulator [Deinococcus psychrotolerans]AZI44320.1 ROK family transcriptional regulator [Deinococcus psychrotolerans]
MSLDTVIQALQRHGALSRADLSRVTGLSKPTISHTIERLYQRDLVVEQLPLSQGQVGRPRTLLRLNSKQWAVAAIDLGGTQIRLSVGDASGQHLHRLAFKTNATLTAQQLIALIQRGLREAVAAVSIPFEALKTVVLGLPGVVDPDTGALNFVPNLPHLEGVPLFELLSRHFPFPFLIENDVNLAAYGQHLQSGDLRSSIFLGIGTGLGVGVVLNSEVHSGHRGRAGEIGYVPYGHGTIEDIVSGAGLQAAYQARTGQWRDAHFILGAANSNADARAVTDTFLAGLAWLLGLLSVSYDPECIFLGGGVGLHLPVDLNAVSIQIFKQFPFTVPLAISSLGDDAALCGGLIKAARVSAEQILSTLENA